MKLEIELLEKLYDAVCQAAKNLKMTPKRFAVTASRQLAQSNQHSGEEITASLTKFFEENPDLNNIAAMRLWEN